MQPTITPVSSRYGAPMGRAEWPAEPVGPVRLFRVKIDAGGYDSGGAYWGLGLPLYCATDGEGFRVFVRALDRTAAARDVTDRYPGCRVRRTAAPRRIWWTAGSGRIELSFTRAQAAHVPLSGAADGAVADLVDHPDLAAQLAAIDPTVLREELDEYGAWDDVELADHAENLQRLVWLAACDLNERGEV